MMIRQIAALCFAATLAWDYSSRYDYLFGYFSTWSLLIQFIYFQLPIKSRALVFAHVLAFICSTAVPLHYLYSLLWNPLIEVNNAAEWEISYSTVVFRSVLVHFSPVFFHALDITTNQAWLIKSYQNHPRRVMVLWALVSYPFYSFIFELFNSHSTTTSASSVLSPNEEEDIELVYLSHWGGKYLVPLAFYIFSFFLLTMLVLRPAYNNGMSKMRMRSASYESRNNNINSSGSSGSLTSNVGSNSNIYNRNMAMSAAVGNISQNSIASISSSSNSLNNSNSSTNINFNNSSKRRSNSYINSTATVTSVTATVNSPVKQ